MRFNDLKAALQPTLDEDLGKIYAEFVRTSGTGDLVRFIGYLREQGKVDPKVLQDLISDGVIDASAVQDLARRNTPSPAVSRLHAPTLMPDVDDDDDDVEAPGGATYSEPDSPAAPMYSEPEVPPPHSATQAMAAGSVAGASDDTNPEQAVNEPASDEPAPGAPSGDAASDESAEAAAASPVAEASTATDEASAQGQGAADDDSDTGSDEADDDGSGTGGRPRRRGEARGTGARRRSGRDTGARRAGEGRDTGARRAGGGTAARDRLKRTMFALREQNDQSVTDGTDLLRRDYKFVGKVGEGAMGRVLKAKDNDLLRLVAYKEMSEEIASNAALASKFYAEAQITAQLDHPNIVPVYQLEQSGDGMLAYTMKLIKGKTVEDYIDEIKAAYEKDKRNIPSEYSMENRLDLFLRCCDALYYAHRRGIVHRDLKPENIMIGHYGEVYVMDWGIAKVVHESDIITEDRVELLYEPQEEGDLIIGTPQYMSPEQANGDNETLDHKSDMYSMGLILYELVSLRQAVTGKSAMKIVMRQQDGDKEPLQHAFGEAIPRELRAIVEKATTKDRSKRYDHIQALAEDIRRYMRDEPVLARPDTSAQAAGRWIRRHTALTAFAVLTILFLSVLGVISIGAGAAYFNFQQSARQTKLNGLRSSVFAQASKIDGQFIKYEGLLGTIAATASEKLTLSGADVVGHYDVADFGGDEPKVPGMVKSGRYGYPVNLEYPVFLSAAKGDGPESALAERQISQLAGMGGNLRTVLLRSESEEAARFTPARYKRRIAEQGTPLTWAFIGLQSGAYVLYPGKGDITGFDPREQPWYEEIAKVAQRQPGPRWSVPIPDYHAQGFVLNVSQPIFDLQDSLLGVTGVSLTFDYLIDALLQMPEEIKGVREVLILNEKGERIISTEDKGKKPEGGRSRAKRLSEFDVKEVVDAVTSFEKAGTVSLFRDDERQLVFFNRMEALGWYLVVIGNESDMLSSDI